MFLGEIMEKIKYLIKRILHMNYKNFFKTIHNVKKKTKKPYIYIFFDCIICGLKYQAGYLDYSLFEMYNMNSKQRSTVLTRGVNNHYIKLHNHKGFTHIFENKNEFNEKFDAYVKREWMVLTKDNKKEFEEFIKDKDEVIIKPIAGTHGDGVRKIKPDKKTYNSLKDEMPILVEEVIKQIPEMNKLNSSSVNTIRVITFNENGKTTIITAYLRVGNNKVVDNFNGGGMVVPINVKTHTIEYPAIDKKGNLYEAHPSTGTKFIGFKIPHFDKIEKLVTDAGKVIPEVKYVGWDVALSTKGALLVEGNDMPGHDIYQLPAHRTNNIGVKPIFDEVLIKK